ncbi:MAG: ABC transporter permease, partial [Myxococcota bacterium]
MSTLRILWAFLVRDVKNAASYRLLLFVQTTSVLTLSFTFFFLALMLRGVEGHIPSLQPYGGRYFGFALIGLALSGFLDAALRAFSTSLRQAQMTGTFAAMLATGAPLGAIVAGSGLYTLLFTTARAGLFFVLGATLFGLPFEGAQWGAAGVILALTVAVTGILGLFAAGFVVRYKQGDPITAGLAGLSWLFSGVLYPKEIFPAPVQAMASLLPLTHCLEG